jgi:uncharacterized repeat protein (TIGR02543 family)
MAAKVGTRALGIASFTLAAVALWFASTSAPAIALTWNLPAAPLSAPGAYPPQVAVAPDGTTTVVWSRDDGSGNYTVQARTRPAASDTFGAVQDLSGPSDDDLLPQVAVAPDGTTTVVWYRLVGSNYIVQARTRPAGSDTFGAVQDLSDPAGGNSRRPQVAVGVDGATTVVWRQDGTPNRIFAATRPAGSGAFGSAVPLSGPTGDDASGPQVAVGADGATTVVWRLDLPPGSSGRIQASTRPAGSGTFGSAVPLSGPSDSDLDPKVAVAPDGATTVVWRQYDDSAGGCCWIVQASTRPAGSGTFGVVEDLSASGAQPGDGATEPEVAVAPDGATTVVWSRDDGSEAIVQARTRPAGSNTFGAVEPLSASGEFARYAQVAVAPDGATTVVWSRNNLSDYIVQARTRPAGSGTFGAVQDLSAPAIFPFLPQLAIGGDGMTTVVWNRFDGSDVVVEYVSSAATNRTLTSQLNGDGTGTVSSVPAGINCGSACSAGFRFASSVTLTADPAAGSTFAGWGGDCSGSSPTCTVTMLGDRSVTATFTGSGPTPPTPSNSFTVRSPLLVGTGIRTLVRVPGPGVIRQSGTFRSRGKVRRACISSSRAASAAGTYRLRCQLTKAARAARKKGAVRVRLTTTFTPTGGTSRAVVRTVVLRSLKPRFTG